MPRPVDEKTAGRHAAAKGFANEIRLLAAFLERDYNASRVDSPLSTYDIVVELVQSDFFRVQVKTVGKGNSISFVGGLRGGIDRKYKSGVKEYVQNTETADIVVGVKSVQKNGDSEINFYFIPTLLIEKIGQKSISINKVPEAKNNWEVFENCRDFAFVQKVFSKLLTQKK